MGKTTNRHEVIASICTLCDPLFPCGVNLHVKDGVITRVEGDTGHNYSCGKLCFEGAALRRQIYSPKRIKTPLKRAGNRFEKISWDHALETIADRLGKIRGDHGSDAVVFSAGNRYIEPYLRQFAAEFGSQNYMDFGNQATSAVCAAETEVFGESVGVDLANSQCLLVWGIQSFNANIQDLRHIVEAKARGKRIIMINSSIAPISALADLHLTPKPGTEQILALALAHVIIDRQLYDEGIYTFAEGFDDFAECASQYPPEVSSVITSVKSHDIIKAALKLVSNPPVSLLVPVAPDMQHINATKTLKTLFSLMGITGNVNMNRGIPPINTGDKGTPKSMCPTQFLSTLNSSKTKVLFAHDLTFRELPGKDIMEKLRDELDFIVLVSNTADDITKYADIILPSCSSVERKDIRTYPGTETVSVEPAIEPLYESRPEVDILIELAERLGIDPKSLELKPKETPMMSKDMPKTLIKLFPTTKSDGHREIVGTLPEKYPYILRISFDFPTFVAEESLFRSKLEDTDVERVFLSSKDAGKLRIESGDMAQIDTPAGSVSAETLVTDTISPGTVYFYAPRIFDEGNPLLEGTHFDPTSGIYGYKSMVCGIRKTSRRGDGKP